MAFGRLKVDQIETSTQIINVDDLTASNGISDGDKGDITVASGGTAWTVNNEAVSYNELADLPSFTGPVVAGRESGTGALQGLSLGSGLSISGGTLLVAISGGGAGTVTSVGLTAPSGFAVAGSPITSSGNITLSFASGYSLPTTTSQANWDTAYSERLYWDGGSTGLNAASGRTSLGLAAVASTGAYGDLTGTPVIPSGADATPQPLGVAAVGISTDYAREDHIHAMPSAGDVGADPAGTAASGISSHEAATDPHPNYALESSLGGAALLNVGTTSGTVAAGDDSRFVASGGTTGQVLTKTSSTDYDADWSDLPARTTTAAGVLPATSYTGISYAATVNLDMAAYDGQYRTITLGGNLTFGASSNMAAGRTVVLRIEADGTQRTLGFPNGWKFLGTKPANIAALKTGVLSLTFFGTADSDCVAAWGVQG